MSSINSEILRVSAAFGAGQATSFEVGYTVAFGRRPVVTVAKEEESILDYCDEQVKKEEEDDWDAEIRPSESDWDTDEEVRPLFRCELRQMKEDKKAARKQQELEDRDGYFQVGLVANRKERREILAMTGRHRVLPYPYVTVFIVLCIFFSHSQQYKGCSPPPAPAGSNQGVGDGREGRVHVLLVTLSPLPIQQQTLPSGPQTAHQTLPGHLSSLRHFSKKKKKQSARSPPPKREAPPPPKKKEKARGNKTQRREVTHSQRHRSRSRTMYRTT